ncbi:MAG TPA: MBL fold metallo-hydrolase, partial [Anaerolineaceae bacterium]|nr:MBL fold metallo-hydrolase [Anaerolineaceae bacterium]
MLKRFPIHHLLFALSPLLLLLAHNADPLQIGVVLRTGVLWLGGGVGLYALFWALTRHPLRAALLASLCLLFLFAYDPAYELVRGRSLLGVTLGKHRFLAPVWAGVLAACAYGTWRRLARPQRLTPVYTAAGLVMLGLSLAGVTVAGAWQPALRAAGLLPPPGLEVTFIDVGNVVPGEPGVVGEAIWLQTADGENALIDGGFPNPVVAAYLQDHGVTRLDLVVLTHAHDDHSGGLIDVLGSIPVDVLVHSGQTLDSP